MSEQRIRRARLVLASAALISLGCAPAAPSAPRDGSGTAGDHEGPAADAGRGDAPDASRPTGAAPDASLDRSDDLPTISPDASSSGDAATGAAVPYGGLRQSNVVIGNVFLSQPGAIAFVANDQAGFLMQVGWSGTPGTAAPDGSINTLRFAQNGANIAFDWTRTGNAIAARLSADKSTTFALKLIPSWSSFKTTYAGTPDGAVGTGAIAQGKTVTWTLKASQSPAQGSGGGTVAFALTANTPVQIVAGFDGFLPFASVDDAIDQADRDYAARRIAASGAWGDFAGAITDNVNNTRLYSSATQRVAHTVSRGWSTDPDYPVFFCWDSFFTGLLASLEDPETGRDTVRGILSFQGADGLVPNFGGWKNAAAGFTSTDRSQPPVGALAVWKMHQRWPDMAFLAEVYPKLVLWHDWWPKARDGNKNGLLEWGTATGSFQNAQYETGWDDNVEYSGAGMVGTNMNVDAVDLNSLWAMDAEYLAAIATALGKTDDATRFAADHDKMATLINDLLWNDQLGMYCSRPWNPVNGNVFLTRMTPMNFYPLIAGVPDATRAASILKVMTGPKFWGDRILPTVAFDDPIWPQQRYWHGTIWGPVNYLVFQGLKRYATPDIQAEFARRSVSLFMTNWTQQGTCGENFLSTTGELGGDLHYTWGALLNLIGIEAAADADANGAPVPGKGFTDAFQARQRPFRRQALRHPSERRRLPRCPGRSDDRAVPRRRQVISPSRAINASRPSRP